MVRSLSFSFYQRTFWKIWTLTFSFLDKEELRFYRIPLGFFIRGFSWEKQPGPVQYAVSYEQVFPVYTDRKELLLAGEKGCDTYGMLEITCHLESFLMLPKATSWEKI